jgi:putative methyltransferase
MHKKNIYLFQPQYSVDFRKEPNYWLPYSSGCLWSYASQFDDITNNFVLADLIFRREDPADILDRIEDPVYCGFSVYVWNAQYCLILAEMIKKRWPQCIIQFGGPHVSGRHIKYKFVDSIVCGEGEEKFVETLRAILANQPVQMLSQKQRLQKLDIPSPYTSGVFNTIVADNPDVLWSMTFETNRGCPYACTFCDWGGVTYSKIKKFSLEHVQADLEWAVNNPVSFLFLADANFGIFKQRDLEIARMIRSVADRSRVDAINIQYAKNSTDEVFEIAKIIGPYSRGITVSVQSMNPDTLTAIKRDNLDVNNIAKLMEISDKTDVGTYTEVILGLPLETLETWKRGLTELLELGQHKSIDIWFAQILENSELAQEHSRKKYGILTINASDYSGFSNANDYKGITDESIELICATNTMSTNDIVEGFMYAWMILHFHIVGYTQYLSKYARYKKNISYKTFYDNLFNKINNSEPFQLYLAQIKNVVQHYLTTGKMLDFENHSRGGHGLQSVGGLFVYENRKHVYKLSQQVLEELTDIDPGIKALQQHSIVDKDHQYPVMLDLDFDIDTWQDAQHKYIVIPVASLTEEFDFYMNRRKGLLKNKIKLINNKI